MKFRQKKVCRGVWIFDIARMFPTMGGLKFIFIFGPNQVKLENENNETQAFKPSSSSC